MQKSSGIFSFLIVLGIHLSLLLMGSGEQAKSKVSISFKKSIYQKVQSNSNRPKKLALPGKQVKPEIQSHKQDEGIDEKLTPTTNLAPEYPYLSQLKGEEGVVRVKVTIDQSGDVTESMIEQSSSHSRLDEATLKAINQTKFEAPKKSGSLSQVLEFKFNLKETD